jgi:hypothetical protein
MLPLVQESISRISEVSRVILQFFPTGPEEAIRQAGLPARARRDTIAAMRDPNATEKVNFRAIAEVKHALDRLVADARAMVPRATIAGQAQRTTNQSLLSAMVLWLSSLTAAEQLEILGRGHAILDGLLALDRPDFEWKRREAGGNPGPAGEVSSKPTVRGTDVRLPAAGETPPRKRRG